MDAQLLDKIVAAMVHARDHASNLTQFGFVADQKLRCGYYDSSKHDICQWVDGACVAALRYVDLPKKPTPFWLLSSGAPDEKTWNGVKVGGVDRQGYRTLQPNNLSLSWYQYLAGPESPYVNLLPHLVNSDPEFINQHGWIFEDANELPFLTLYNFCQASRKCMEFRSSFKFWKQLTEGGMNPRQADVISCGWRPVDGVLVECGRDPGHCHLNETMPHRLYKRYVGKSPEDKSTFNSKSGRAGLIWQSGSKYKNFDQGFKSTDELIAALEA